MSSVRLQRLCRAFPGSQRPAVRDVDIDVCDGELVVLVGPSGCGKSTTLRMVAGLEIPDSGRILIGDRDVTDLEPRERNVAMVFQNYALYPQKTVFANLAFGLKMRGMGEAEIQRRVREAAGLLGLDELLERKPRQLSGGQMQRVALGRALVREPDVFLLDEPLSNLDAKLRVRMREEIAAIHERTGTSMIYVTHDQVEAMTLGDRIVVMKDGLVQQIGRPVDLYDRPETAFVAGFIGSPEMNLIDGMVDASSGRAHFRTDALAMPIDEAFDGGIAPGPMHLGIRPEHITPTSAERANARLQASRIEQLGATTLVSGTIGESRVCALFERDDEARPGDSIPVHLPVNRLHLFDRQTGRRTSR